MNKNLYIDLDQVNGAIEKLETKLQELVQCHTKANQIVDNDFDAAWSSTGAAKVRSQLSSFAGSIQTIKSSIESIKNAVSQYSKNVVTVDESVTLNRGNSNGQGGNGTNSRMTQ